MAVIRNNLQTLYQRLDRYPDWFLASFTTIFVVIFAAVAAVIFFDLASAWMGYLLYTDDKGEALGFIALIISGLVSFMGILVLRQRVRSAEKQTEITRDAVNNQAEAAKSQAKANKLTEAGRTQELLKTFIEHLGSDKPSVRIGAAYELTEAGRTQELLKTSIEHLGNDKPSVRIGAAYGLYHLAKDNRSCRETICDILCGHIRQKTQEGNYAVRHEHGPSEEVN